MVYLDKSWGCGGGRLKAENWKSGRREGVVYLQKSGGRGLMGGGGGPAGFKKEKRDEGGVCGLIQNIL